MPLDRAHVTVASRLMLPTYASLALFFGVLYVTDPQGRLQRSPGLALARMLMPMWAWGLILLTTAAVMIVALVSHRRMWFITALYFYAFVGFAWAVIYTGAVFLTSDSSLGTGAWPLLLGVSCIASAKSLIAGEGR